MNKAQPIYWHQGMFLQPQHFQQSEQFLGRQVDVLRQNVSPWLWGFINLEVANAAVSSKRVEILEAEILFQDGTHAKTNENAYLQPRSLEGIEVDPESPLTAYIALRKPSAFEANVSVIQEMNEANDVKTRLFTLATPTEANDVYSNSEPAQTQNLTLKLDIVFETEKDKYSDYLLMPFAKIAFDGDNLTLVTDYIPPSINISGSTRLNYLLKELRDELAGRAIQLNNSQTMTAHSQVDINTLRYRMGLQALSRFVPRLFHETETPQMHPWAIYGGIRELVGEISTFAQDINFLGEASNGDRLLPEYEHLNIGECFTSARTLISQLLNEISIGPQFMVDMDRNQQTFSVDIPSEFFEDRTDFYLVLNTKDEWEEQAQSFFTSAKLAAKSTVDVLIERALPGIGMMHLPAAPSGLPKKAFANYVRIDVHDDEWQSVQRQHNLVLHWDEAPEDLHIELVILKR